MLWFIISDQYMFCQRHSLQIFADLLKVRHGVIARYMLQSVCYLLLVRCELAHIFILNWYANRREFLSTCIIMFDLMYRTLNVLYKGIEVKFKIWPSPFVNTSPEIKQDQCQFIFSFDSLKRDRFWVRTYIYLQ